MTMPRDQQKAAFAKRTSSKLRATKATRSLAAGTREAPLQIKRLSATEFDVTHGPHYDWHLLREGKTWLLHQFDSRIPYPNNDDQDPLVAVTEHPSKAEALQHIREAPWPKRRRPA
jgi:hypothetical protein